MKKIVLRQSELDDLKFANQTLIKEVDSLRGMLNTYIRRLDKKSEYVRILEERNWYERLFNLGLESCTTTTDIKNSSPPWFTRLRITLTAWFSSCKLLRGMRNKSQT